MNVSARKVLRSRKQFILENLILNDEMLDKLEDNGILNEDMIQQINAERTDYLKITKLLYILKRRGPTAFEHFVEAIRSDFSFVSEILETEYANILDSTNNNDGSSSEASNHDLPRHSSEESLSTVQIQSENLNNNQRSSIGTQTYEVERNRNSDFMQRMMQESFGCWYTKIKSHMTNRNLRELSFRSPVPITFDMVDQLIDELIATIEGCYKALRVKDNLVTHVIELKESRKKLKKELNEKELVRNKYAHNTIKLENKCRDISEKLDEEIRNNQKLHADLACLKDELEANIKEKDHQIEILKHQLENIVSKSNNGNIKYEKVQKAETERKNREYVDSYDSETERRELIGQRTWQESKRSRSIEDYQQKRHIEYFKCSPRMDKNYRHKSSDISKHVRKMQHSNGQESKELPAVEEPDGARLARTKSFVESHKNQRSIPQGNTKKDQSQSSDKENNDDLYCQKGELHATEADGNNKQEQPNLMVSNTSKSLNTLSEQTEFNRQARGRRNSQRRKPRRKNSERQRVWIGTNENNQEVFQRVPKNASTEMKGLSSLVIVNNSKSSSQNGSPRRS